MPGQRSHALTRDVALACLLLAATLPCGCRRWNGGFNFGGWGSPEVVAVPLDNPLHVGPIDPDFVWRMVVDTVDDYFRIASEQAVRRDQGAWLEGKLTTFPEVSGTSFEPWRRDTTPGFERLQSTFQTIRRIATIRVTPESSGYAIEVRVVKEQEDVDQSQFAAAGSAAQRHDGTVVRSEAQPRPVPATLGWYEIGRDVALEQRILEGIAGRITDVDPPRHRWLHH
ncbi:MAG: hypothetical protein KatS3mg111_1070 [Pirellulaceae bacterium]|nr:MAG: hypothetical protein KatS3mg111_1070 [Pirellulaceae bacterium]